MRPGWLHARLAAVNEIGASLLMVLGLAFPLAGAAFVGLMAVAAMTDHRGKGFFVFKGGWEYVALIGAVSAALVSTGPGNWSVDHALDWHLAGPGYAGLALLAGVALAVGLLVMATRGSQRRAGADAASEKAQS